jgi:hypothetical protein
MIYLNIMSVVTQLIAKIWRMLIGQGVSSRAPVIVAHVICFMVALQLSSPIDGNLTFHCNFHS